MHTPGTLAGLANLEVLDDGLPIIVTVGPLSEGANDHRLGENHRAPHHFPLPVAFRLLQTEQMANGFLSGLGDLFLIQFSGRFHDMAGRMRADWRWRKA